MVIRGRGEGRTVGCVSGGGRRGVVCVGSGRLVCGGNVGDGGTGRYVVGLV